MKKIGIAGYVGPSGLTGRVAVLEPTQREKIAIVTTGDPQDLLVLEEARRTLGVNFEVVSLTNSEIEAAVASGTYTHILKLNACIDDDPAYSVHQAAHIAKKVMQEGLPKEAPVERIYPQGRESRRERRLQQRRRI